MKKKILCLTLTIVLTGTALQLSDSAFSNPVYSDVLDISQISDSIITEEITTGDAVEVTEGGITGPSVIDSTDNAIKEKDDSKSKSKGNTNPNKKQSEPAEISTLDTEPTSEAITTPEPIRNTKLVTNPYKGYSYSRLISEIKKLQSQYPDIIKAEYMGKTANKRNIPLVKLGTGDKKILIVGSEHAREYVTTSLIMHSIDTYAQAYVKDRKIDGTSVKNVLDKVTFYFVPMLNIDGVQLVLGTSTARDKKIAKKYVGKRHYAKYRKMWKANGRGVDLNRNYPFRWSKGNTTRNRSYMSFKGRRQASEPEVKSIVNLCKKNKFAFMFTMHTRGQIIYWKDKYNGTVPGASTLVRKVRSVTKYRTMPTSGWSSCAGESAKWFRYVYNKPAFTIELMPTKVAYNKAVKKTNFNKYVWNKNKSLFLKTALTVKPSSKYKAFLSAGKGKTGKRYVSYNSGKKIGKLPKAKRKGYKFKGWYTSGGKKVTKNSRVTSTTNIRLYAKYKKK